MHAAIRPSLFARATAPRGTNLRWTAVRSVTSRVGVVMDGNSAAAYAAYALSEQVRPYV
jgi:hypothetical protein